MSPEVFAVGANMLAAVGPAIAAVIFGRRWWMARGQGSEGGLAFMYLVFSVGMFLNAFQRGYWEIYYIAEARGWSETAAFMIESQAASVVIGGVSGFVCLLHIRFAFERAVGARWLALTISIAVGVFALGTLLGVSAPRPGL